MSLQAKLPRLRGLISDWDRLDRLISVTTEDSPDRIDTLRRRLNREPGTAIAALELGAELLTETLYRTDRRTVALVGVDRTDSLTIRLLARAAVRAGFQDRVQYDWIACKIPFPNPDIVSPEDFRFGLLTRILDSGVFRLRTPLQSSSFLTPAHDFDVSAAHRDLAAHNYDHAFARADRGTAGPASARIAALALVAGGEFLGAARLLTHSLKHEPDPLVRAHLYCLLGLLESKRFDHLSDAEALFNSGLNELVSASPGVAANVERAWILNGLALIHALRFGATRSEGEVLSAYRLCRDALVLIGSERDPESSYLRFNLLANTALLHEMRGDYQRALMIMQSAVGITGAESTDTRARAVYEYRVGLLDLRAGTNEWSPDRIDASSLAIEDWPVADHILRLSGVWYLWHGKPSDATRSLESGVQLTQQTRSAAAMTFYSDALTLTLDHNVEENRIASLMARLPSKLPTNLAEIDFDFEPSRRVGEKLRA